jgi:hypothetical protein
MARIALYDPVDTLVVTDFSESADQYRPPWNVANRVINFDTTGLYDLVNHTYIVPLYYWKHVAGVISEMSQAEKDAYDAAEAAAAELAVRGGAKGGLLGFVSSALLHRAFADILKDEFNAVRGWITDFKVEVAAANNLADLKARIAGLPDLPDRTLAQLKTAIRNRIDSGSVDPD